MSVLSDFFGTPPNHQAEKAETNTVAVKTPEFDITQYVKKLGVSIGVLAGASAGALKLFHLKAITPGIVAAGLGVTAVALLGVCFVSAVDIAARAYVTRGTPPPDPDSQSDASEPGAKAPLPVGAVARRVVVWLEGEAQPRLVLAVAGNGKQSKYLLSGSDVGKRDQGEASVPSLEGSPAWHDANEVRAVRATGWP